MSQTDPSARLTATTPLCNGQEGQAPVFVKKNSTKDYSDTVRVYDTDGFRLRSDAVCFSDKHKSKVLLASSRNWVGQWTIPGGGLEPNETMEQAALREAMEEAGVEGTLYEFVGSFDNGKNRTRTKVFTMIVSKEVHSWKDNQQISRERKWFTKEEAVSMLKIRSPIKCKYLEAACFSTSNALINPTTSNGETPAVRTNNHSGSNDPSMYHTQLVDGVRSNDSNSACSTNSVYRSHGNGSCQDSSSKTMCSQEGT